MKQGQKKSKFDKDLIHTKTGKYFLAVRQGKTKKEAQQIAGYKTDTHATSIEKSKEFQALKAHFADSFLAKMSMDEVSDALIDNIKQEGAKRIDRNARNGAIKIALDKLEPESKNPSDDDARVLIVLGK